MADESEMVLGPVDKITVGPRYRQDLGDIARLAKSIQAVGCYSPSSSRRTGSWSPAAGAWRPSSSWPSRSRPSRRSRPTS
jgi:hypothetical protein